MKTLVTELKEALGERLVSVTWLKPQTQDHGDASSLSTVLLVLRDGTPDTLETARRPLREARRRVRVEPLILVDGEQANMLDVWPLKALSFRFHGAVQHGPAPFADLKIDQSHVRLRLEQQARNLLVRLRHDVCLSDNTEHRLRAGIWRTVRGIAYMLDGLWYLDCGEDVPPDTWHALSDQWGLAPELLDQLSHITSKEIADQSGELAAQLLSALEDLVKRVDRHNV